MRAGKTKVFLALVALTAGCTELVYVFPDHVAGGRPFEAYIELPPARMGSTTIKTRTPFVCLELPDGWKLDKATYWARMDGKKETRGDADLDAEFALKAVVDLGGRWKCASGPEMKTNALGGGKVVFTLQAPDGYEGPASIRSAIGSKEEGIAIKSQDTLEVVPVTDQRAPNADRPKSDPKLKAAFEETMIDTHNLATRVRGVVDRFPTQIADMTAMESQLPVIIPLAQSVVRLDGRLDTLVERAEGTNIATDYYLKKVAADREETRALLAECFAKALKPRTAQIRVLLETEDDETALDKAIDLLVDAETKLDQAGDLVPADRIEDLSRIGLDLSEQFGDLDAKQRWGARCAVGCESASWKAQGYIAWAEAVRKRDGDKSAAAEVCRKAAADLDPGAMKDVDKACKKLAGKGWEE